MIRSLYFMICITWHVKWFRRCQEKEAVWRARAHYAEIRYPDNLIFYGAALAEICRWNYRVQKHYQKLRRLAYAYVDG